MHKGSWSPDSNQRRTNDNADQSRYYRAVCADVGPARSSWSGMSAGGCTLPVVTAPARRPITSQAVIDALGALGLAPTLPHTATDRDLPTLLGALLAATETAISHHVSTDDQWMGVLQGQIGQSDATPDPTPFLLLTAMRLTKTWRELAQLLEDSGQPDHPFLSLAAEAAHAASTVITLHLTAIDQDRYNMTEQDFRFQLETLQAAVQEVIQRHNRLMGMLPPAQ